ncbi:MAG: cytosine permease [Bifidobacteriaceae bacterium]|jgi:purine-cytosine permease-like protein|nr:cytosine permease [Bifidobacteriaceae bacterium]
MENINQTISEVKKADGGSKGSFEIEIAGADIIKDQDRKGTPQSLFWPWFAANISVLGISYGAWVLDFGISFVQATLIGVIGIILSFFFCGVVALAGKRGSAPTMVLSRAAFGVNGNKVASILSWLLTVGWETILTATAVLAMATVFNTLGWQDSDSTIKIVAMIVVCVLIIGGGVIGFNLIMKMQTFITVATGILTVIYIALTWNTLDFSAALAIPNGDHQMVIGALVFILTGFGLGWVNMAADYSRYLPRKSKDSAVVFWTTFSASCAPIILLLFGLLLAGSNPDLHSAISADPVGALTTILPTWFLIPFALVALLGLIGGALLDIYSSGLALVSMGVPVPRYVAAGIDGVIMTLGTIYIAFGGDDFFVVFQGFLITLGVPIAVWAGIMLADTIMRKAAYSEKDLFDPSGRYGNINPVAISLMVVGTVIGWGFVTNSYASWLQWQGYFLNMFGLSETAWSWANLGVLFALLIGFLGTLIFARSSIKQQESQPPRLID